MDVESVGKISTRMPASVSTLQQVEKNQRRAVDNVNEKDVRQNLVAPEEVLNKIKGLTEGGLHSVRFEMNDDLSMMIISVVDKDTGDTIRQIPAEELIESKVYLKHLRGSLVSTEI